jgi:biopolymer transport protein ExbB
MNVKVVISAAAAMGAAAVTSSTTAWADTGTTVKNPYGLAALWADGDFVSKTTLIILVIMSLGTWYVGIVKLFEQSKLFKQGKEAAAKSWRTETMVADVQAQSEESAFRFLAHSTIEAAMSYDTGQSQRVAFDQWLEISAQRAVNVINGRLQGGLPLLATVGSTAPFVGLFGTVWGIYHALTAIGMSGQASIDKVAGPVGEALIMTAIGLAVAVPAVLGYNWLVRRNKVAMERVRHFGASLQMTLLSRR